MFNVLALVQIALAVYLVVGAVSGKNKIFVHRFCKEGKQPLYKKWMRVFFGVAGGLLAVLGVANIVGSLQPEGSALFDAMATAGMVIGVLILTLLMGMFVFYQLLTDREKKNAPMRSTAPRAAFYFDEDEAGGEKSPNNDKKKR